MGSFLLLLAVGISTWLITAFVAASSLSSLDRSRSRLRRVLKLLLPTRPSDIRSPPKDRLSLRQDPWQALWFDPQQQTQWWYFSGNLISSDHRRWEYELVFFYRKTDHDHLGLWPLHRLKDRLFIAHFGLADIDEKRFRYHHQGGIFSKLSTSASENSLHLRLGTWSFEQTGPQQIRLSAQSEGDVIELFLDSEKKLVVHGPSGFSPRDNDPRIFSFHSSLTRLRTQGTITSEGQRFEVSGLSWLDHEKMVSERNRFNDGWDWCSIQFENSEELMVYRFHNADGQQDDRWTFATFVDASGQSHFIPVSDLLLTPLSYWESPLSGGLYPIHWQIQIPPLNLSIEILPLLQDCELNCVSTTFVAYWEGPVYVNGKKDSMPLSGRGYLELCGYDRRLSSRLVQFALTPEAFE